jgi:hypothetical protein
LEDERGLATAILTKKYSVTISMGPKISLNVRTAFRNTIRFPDFQAEYTRPVTAGSRGDDERAVSVTIVPDFELAAPRGVFANLIVGSETLE